MIRILIDYIFKDSIYFTLQILFCIVGSVTDNIIFFRICTLLTLFFCIFKGSKEKYIVNPYYLIILTPLSLLIYVNVSNSFMVDLTSRTWLLAILNINALLLGFHITKSTKFNERILSTEEQHKLYTFTAWIFIILGVLPSYYFKFTGNSFPISYIITMLSTAGVMCAFSTKNKKLMIIVSMIFLSPILLGGLSKTFILTLLLAMILAYEKYFSSKNSYKAKKGRKKMYIICILAIPMMIYSFSFANKDRGNYNAEEGFGYYASRVNWSLDAVYFLPYMYITTPWTNLQYVTETQNTRTHGYWFTKPILGVFSNDEAEEKKYELEPYSSFNTFTFIALHFKDFGYWGSLFASIFLGFFIKKVYSLFKESNCPYDATQYVYTGQATLELFFSNHFFGLSYPFMIVIIMYITKKIFKI